MSLQDQLKELITTLERYEPNDLVPWQLGKTFNVLLGEAKEAAPDNPIIQAMIEVDSHPSSGYSDTNANGIAGLARQLYAALS